MYFCVILKKTTLKEILKNEEVSLLNYDLMHKINIIVRKILYIIKKCVYRYEYLIIMQVPNSICLKRNPSTYAIVVITKSSLDICNTIVLNFYIKKFETV